MQITTSQTLGPYLLRSYLGGTTLATVYHATHQDTGRAVAVKVLRPYLAQDPDLVDRLFQQMDRASPLRHPHIRQVYDTGRSNGLCYIAMEYTPWETLRERLRHPLSPPEALVILHQVAAALEHAHQQGVPHRNLKPSNIFVGPDLQVLVSDFGMDLLGQAHLAAMKSELASSSAVYRAPELAQGAPQDPYTDVYSLGVLAYELLTRTLPFSATTPSTALVRQLTTQPLTPSQANPGLPPQVDQPLLRCLSRRPDARFPAFRPFIEALEQALSFPAPAPAAPTPATARERLPLAQTTSAAATHELPAQLSEDLLQICPRCGAANELSFHYCLSCWGRLLDAPVATPEEADRLQTQRQRRRRRRLVISTSLLVLPPLVLALLAGYAIATPPVPPPPVTNPSLLSDSGPGEWAMYQGNPARTGVAPAASFVPQGQVAWTFQSDPIESLSEQELKLEGGDRPNTPLFASPAVVDGVLYLPTGDRRIVALDAASGRLLWQHRVTGPVDSSPAVAGDLVYVGLRDGQLVALDNGTGEPRWTFQAGGPIFRSPLVHDGTLYLAASDGFLYALDAATGDLRWSFEGNSRTLSSPAVNHAVVAFTSQGNRLYVLDRETGRQRLAFILQQPSIGAPVLLDHRVLVTTLSGAVFAVDWRLQESDMAQRWYGVRFQMYIMGLIGEIESRTGFLWQYKVPARRDRFLNSVAVTPQAAFGCTVLGRCLALDPETGDQRWLKTLNASVFSAPLVVGDLVYIGAADGNVYAFSASTGETLWQFTTGGQVTANPVFANGILYIASQDGTLYALR